MNAALEKVIESIIAIAARMIENQLTPENYADAWDLAADKMKLKASWQRTLDERKRRA